MPRMLDKYIRGKKMSEPITKEELKDAIEFWAPKFNLIRELWPGASIEESLKLMSVIEERAVEIKEDKKNSMGFGPFVEKTNFNCEGEAYYGWTKDQLNIEEQQKKNTREF